MQGNPHALGKRTLPSQAKPAPPPFAVGPTPAQTEIDGLMQFLNGMAKGNQTPAIPEQDTPKTPGASPVLTANPHDGQQAVKPVTADEEISGLMQFLKSATAPNPLLNGVVNLADTDAGRDVVGGIAEAPRAIYSGAQRGAQALLTATDELGDWLNANVGDFGTIQLTDDKGNLDVRYLSESDPDKTGVTLPGKIERPQTVTGGFIEGISQFLTGFGAAGKIPGLAGAATTRGALAQAAGKGFVADTAFFDAADPGLSNLVNELAKTHPELSNDVTEFLATGPENSNIENRLKRGVEGLGIGVAADGLFLALKAYKAAKLENPGAAKDLTGTDVAKMSSDDLERTVIEDNAPIPGKGDGQPLPQNGRKADSEVRIGQIKSAVVESAKILPKSARVRVAKTIEGMGGGKGQITQDHTAPAHMKGPELSPYYANALNDAKTAVERAEILRSIRDDKRVRKGFASNIAFNVMKNVEAMSAANNDAALDLLADHFGAKSQWDAAKQVEVTSAPKKTTPLYDRQTKSPEFKRWFGSSKIVDENGAPVVLYRGKKTAPRFGETREFQGVDVAFFADSPRIAEVYTDPETGGNITPAYVKMENPFVVDGEGKVAPMDAGNALANSLFKQGRQETFQAVMADVKKLPEDIQRAFAGVSTPEQLHSEYLQMQMTGHDGLEALEFKFPDALSEFIDGYDIPIGKVLLHAKNSGHDGVIFRNILDSDPQIEASVQNQYIVFDDKNIKSAVGNRGTFDPANPDIRFQQDASITGRFDPADPSSGTPLERTIWLSTQSQNSKQTLGHEGVHALRDMDLFTKSEWNILGQAAKQEGWLEKYKIDERYPDLTPAQKAEEAAAEAYGDWFANPKAIKNKGARNLFERIKQFMQSINKTIRKKLNKSTDDELTFEDVFGQITSGEVGKRAGEGLGAKIGAPTSRKQTKPPVLQSPPKTIGSRALQ